MNVYDFDGTIYKNDSSVEFYRYAINREHMLLSVCLPIQTVAYIKYLLRLSSKEQLKEKYFCFLRYIDSERFLKDFVDKEMNNINEWYVKQQREDDVIVSASPRFLVERFAKRLGVKNVIASEVDIRTGKFYSPNCRGEEKVSRFYAAFPNGKIEKFYSDSKSDDPMARIAKEAYLVGKGLKKWEK